MRYPLTWQVSSYCCLFIEPPVSPQPSPARRWDSLMWSECCLLFAQPGKQGNFHPTSYQSWPAVCIISPTLNRSGVNVSSQQTQNICITFVHLYNVGPTSSVLGRRCTNSIQMLCVCWAVKWEHHIDEPDIEPKRQNVTSTDVRFWRL